jgi:hypothetical protein
MKLSAFEMNVPSPQGGSATTAHEVTKVLISKEMFGLMF